MNRSGYLLRLLLLACLVAAIPAAADTLNFLPTSTFSGTAPAGTLSIAFTDVTGGSCPAVGGCVQMVITSNLGTGENLDPNKAIYLNIDPAESSLLGSLTFTLTANTGFAQTASVSQQEDGFKPDGDGLMDLLFTYSPSTKAFTNGESQTYLITGGTALDPILATDFTSFSSTCGSGCGSGSHLAAIHVQNTPNGGSGSAYVGGTPEAQTPEPSALVFVGSGLFGLAALIRKKWAL